MMTRGRPARSRRRDAAISATAAALALVLAVPPAHAGVSAQDGYTADGAYQLNVEVAPYMWLAGVNATAKTVQGATASVNTGVPSVSQITSVMTGAFMGAGLLRYGPYFAQLDIDYFGVAQTTSIPPDALGFPRSAHLSASLTRIAPGFGYQVYNGGLGSVPVTLDAMLGFSWFAAGATIDVDRYGLFGGEHVATAKDNGSFAQPWGGLRARIYPWPRWRFELAGLAQGWDVGNNGWGWGVTVDGAWAATDWMNLVVGFRALNTSRHNDPSHGISSLDITAYGPFAGVGFTF